MKEEPFITVFTPNYNGSKFLSETINSILNQNYSNFEYIIIDDCSTDNSCEIIQDYVKKDNRIKAYKNKSNLKIVETRNKGFNLSSPGAKYFAIIDSDDIALPNRLQFQIEFLENNPEYGLVGSNCIIINEESKVIGFRKFPTEDEEIRKVFTRFNPIVQSSVVLRKNVIEKVGKYDKIWFVCQDYDYWLRVGIYWKLKILEKPLIKYRISKNQIKSIKFKETIKKTCLIQKKAIKKYGYPDSLYNKLYRIALKSFLFYPKILYYMYKIIIIKLGIVV